MRPSGKDTPPRLGTCVGVRRSESSGPLPPPPWPEAISKSECAGEMPEVRGGMNSCGKDVAAAYEPLGVS